MPRTTNSAPAPPDGYVWTKEAARLMSISVATLWNYHHLGKGPKPTRYRGRLAYKLTEVRAHVQAELEGSAQEPAESRPPEPRRPRRTKSAA
ncbi:hypothetical protein ABZ819_04840 [Streptomyces venezuelae]|uniref:helix-turn-helix transcriptional regulator n=1 Tax=Streptomyces venezuelae TaxID=54571 RepID=UPI003419E28A